MLHQMAVVIARIWNSSFYLWTAEYIKPAEGLSNNYNLGSRCGASPQDVKQFFVDIGASIDKTIFELAEETRSTLECKINHWKLSLAFF